MDFWSRLIAGTSLSPASSKAAANNPDKRLARFKREYNQLLVSRTIPDNWKGHSDAFQQIWRGTSNLSQDSDSADAVLSHIQELTSILADESRRPSPHVCISFAAAKQMYLAIGKIATTSYNEPIIREAVAFFSTLIESEEEDFVENDAFSQSLMNLLVRITGANSIRLGSDTEVEVVELAFGIAAKIRLQPEILPAWFRETHEGKGGELGAHEKFTGRTHKEDFPLFYLLIDYIHEEGRVGDFARTGLLYIIESASTSVPLEQWIVESDLATLMSTGLGALYSQLSRKLVIDYPPEELPSILAMSDYQHPTSTTEIVSSASIDFQGHMETFLSHLVFWQDVLEHCKSVEVKQTLLEHFQVIFLQQLLYPSLLESSDIDGGSSVAVLTYLRRILEALDHPDMIHMILHYLLALPDSTPVRPSGSRASVSAARKRKSMDLQTMLAAQSDSVSTPALFNLVDLITGSLKSPNHQTIGTTLQLLSVILRRHHRYAVTTLLKTAKAPTEAAPRTIGVHETEMEFLMGLVDGVGLDDDLEIAYENHVKDSLVLLECHPCSQIMIAPKSSEGLPKSHGQQTLIPGAPRDVQRHTLRADDPILRNILSILDNFYLNPIETNLSLTETIVDLAACGFMDISGWLLPDPSRYTYDEEDGDETPSMTVSVMLPAVQTASQQKIQAVRLAHRHPQFPPSKVPQILTTLQKLAHQAALYKSQIPRFNDLLSNRQLALSTEAPARALPIRHQPPARTSVDESRASRPASPSQKPSTFDSITQRFFADLGTPSRSSTPRDGSPRGRRSLERSGGSGNITPLKQPPRQFPLGLEAPRMGSTDQVGSSRGSSRAFSPSPLRVGREGGAEESQARAFREVDRSILARRVGLPREDGISFPALKQANKKKEGKVDEPIESSDTSKVEASTSEADSTEGKEEEGNASEKEEEEQTVSVSHVLTNTIILQEFLLELAALVQVRAGLFGEVAFV